MAILFSEMYPNQLLFRYLMGDISLIVSAHRLAQYFRIESEFSNEIIKSYDHCARVISYVQDKIRAQTEIERRYMLVSDCRQKYERRISRHHLLLSCPNYAISNISYSNFLILLWNWDYLTLNWWSGESSWKNGKYTERW